MQSPRHPRARHFSTRGLFGGLGRFAELEARITVPPTVTSSAATPDRQPCPTSPDCGIYATLSDPTNPKTDPQHPQHKNYKTNLMRALKAVVDKGALYRDDEGVSPPAVAKNDEGGVA